MNKFGQWIPFFVASALLVTSSLPMLHAEETGTSQVENVRTKATRITRIETREVAKGGQIILHGDGIITHKIFRLNNPERLLIVLDETKLDPTIGRQQLNISHIKEIVPVEAMDNESGRLQITLDRNLEYEVSETSEGLAITLLDPPTATTASQTTINDVKISHSEEGTFIRLQGVGKNISHQTYRMNNPPRLVVDLMASSAAMGNKTMTVNNPELNKVAIGGDKDKTRIVIDLTSPDVTHNIEKTDSFPIIHLGHGLLTAEATTPPTIKDIKFSLEGPTSRLQIDLNRNDIQMINERHDLDVILDLKGVTLPENLVRRMDVSEFGGSIKAIDAFPDGKGGSRIIVRMDNPNVDHQVVQADKNIIVKIAPVDSQALAGEQVLPFNGERISLDFQNIDIQNALRFLMQVTDNNIIISDQVTGTVTLHLQEVPWDQALNLILESRGLGKRQEGNVIWVATLQEIAERTRLAIETESSRKKLEPLVTEMIRLNFAKASQIASSGLLTGKSATSEGGGAQEGAQGGAQGGMNPMLMMAASASNNPQAMAQLAQSMDPNNASGRVLSARGSATFDDRTNTLIVTDTPTHIQRVKDVLKKLDLPIPQVLIEARIVSITREAISNFGINWYGTTRPGRNNHYSISRTVNRAYNALQNTVPDNLPSGNTLDSVDSSPVVGLNGNDAGTINVGAWLGLLHPLLDIGVEISALESLNKAKVISSPRILTTNNVAASIRQGQQIPYPAAAENGGITTQFQNVNLSLEVTPQVTPDGSINMRVNATNDSPGEAGANGIAINTSGVNTEVLVKDGETVILGGVFQINTNLRSRSVPLLGDIPILGHLFRNSQDNENHSELVIFITPQIASKL